MTRVVVVEPAPLMVRQEPAARVVVREPASVLVVEPELETVVVREVSRQIVVQAVGEVGTQVQSVFVGPTAPMFPPPEYLWLQTGLGADGTGFTLWFNDPAS